MAVPNRLDLLARPFRLRWDRAWAEWIGAGHPEDPAAGGLRHELEAMAYRLLRYRKARRHLLAMARRPDRLPGEVRGWFEAASVLEDANPEVDQLWLEVARWRSDGAGSGPRWVVGWGSGRSDSGRAGGADPVWGALLGLRPLRTFWVNQLRAKHLAALSQVVVPGWVVPTDRIPPGGVLPGLAEWQDRCGLEVRADALPDGWERRPLWVADGPQVVVPPVDKVTEVVARAEFDVGEEPGRMALLSAVVPQEESRRAVH